MKKTIIWVSVIAFILVAVYFFMQKDDVEEIDGGESSSGTNTPPVVPPPPTPTQTGGGSSGQLPTGIQLNTEFGEGATLVKNYMRDAIQSGYVTQFRQRMNIGTDLFADTRQNVSEAIRNFVLDNANVNSDSEIPLIPSTVDPLYIQKLKKFFEWLTTADHNFKDRDTTLTNLAREADLSNYGFRFAAPTRQNIWRDYIEPYGRCKKDDCKNKNVERLITRELPPTVQNFIDATVRLDKELRAEAIRALMESGYKFVGI